MPSSKGKMVNVRLTPAVHNDFKIACDLRGASMSSLMHQFIVRTIREEREREPQAFAHRKHPVIGKQLPALSDGDPGIPFGGVASGGKTKTEEKRNKG